PALCEAALLLKPFIQAALFFLIHYEGLMIIIIRLRAASIQKKTPWIYHGVLGNYNKVYLNSVFSVPIGKIEN
ncbi:hypothetical protein QTO02_23920, partial [Vibrio fortis]